MWLVSRVPQRSFVYLGSVYVLDPNRQPLAPPLIHFENGELGIVGKYFGCLFSARSFDFPSHGITLLKPDPSLARKNTRHVVEPASDARGAPAAGAGQITCRSTTLRPFLNGPGRGRDDVMLATHWEFQVLPPGARDASVTPRFLHTLSAGKSLQIAVAGH